MSHHARYMRFGVIHDTSNDKGPYKLVKAMADGKKMDVEVMDITGVEGSPLKDSRLLILTPDGDDGKAVGLVYGPAVKDRTDQQKPGEVTYKNHKTGTVTTFRDNGDIEIDCKNDQIIKVKGNSTLTADGNVKIEASEITLKGSLKFEGDIVHTGNMTTSGVHTDSAGPHGGGGAV